ncbi:MAG: iron ABC transporter permease [Proteobacteria bacterium]|nr:iron ABC transporter permease [Pseudomonadota bacterium]MBI3497468.1 iron ABC transporter permease [Pseudomonadota bacterium]
MALRGVGLGEAASGNRRFRSVRLALSTESVVAIVLSVVLTVLVILPLIAVAMGAVKDAGGLSLQPFLTVLSATRIITNTVLVGTGTTILAVTLGGALALILARIDTPGRSALEQLVIMPLYITPLLTAIAWSWLGSPRGGLVNLFARQVFGIDSLVNLQTAGGVIFVAALAYVPLPFLLIGAALRVMDPSLEESARIHGASQLDSLRLVTLPLVLPSALGSALLVFVQAMGLFSVPAVLGMPSGFYVVGTEIYRLLNNFPPRVSQAAAWGLLLLAVTAALVWLQGVILNRRSFVTITGKAFRPRILDVGAFRYLLAALAWIYVALAVLLPVATLIWAALVNFITIDVKLMAFDLRHFRYVLFQYPKTFLAMQNSLILGAATASAVCVLGLGVSWVVVRSRSPVRSYLDQVGMFPLATPSMVLALGLLWVYVAIKWLPIYGTIGILLLAYVTHYLPFGIRAGTGALRQLHAELEDAARMTGATWSKMVRWITLPLTRPTLIATWTLIFILSMQEVSSSILLYTSRTVVLAVAVFDLWEAGNVNALAALSVLQLAVTFLALLVMIRARHRQVLV